jgi:DNA/RNA endonuclease G (NUC1)
MAGPVLTPKDKPYRKVLVPRGFWKVLIYQRNKEIRSRGFIVTQKLAGLRRAVSPLDEFQVYERSLQLIASKACVSFDPALDSAQRRGRPDRRRSSRRQFTRGRSH